MKFREFSNAWTLPERRPARASNPTTTFLPPGRYRVFEQVDPPPRSTVCCALCRASAVLLAGDASTPQDAARAAGWQVQGERVVCRRCARREHERRAGEPRGRTTP